MCHLNIFFVWHAHAFLPCSSSSNIVASCPPAHLLSHASCHACGIMSHGLVHVQQLSSSHGSMSCPSSVCVCVCLNICAAALTALALSPSHGFFDISVENSMLLNFYALGSSTLIHSHFALSHALSKQTIWHSVLGFCTHSISCFGVSSLMSHLAWKPLH